MRFLPRVLRKIGHTAAAPVVLPYKAAKRGAEKTMQAAIFGVLRHSLTTAGGALVANGWMGNSDLEAGVGAILTIAGIVASIISKRRALAKS